MGLIVLLSSLISFVAGGLAVILVEISAAQNLLDPYRDFVVSLTEIFSGG